MEGCEKINELEFIEYLEKKHLTPNVRLILKMIYKQWVAEDVVLGITNQKQKEIGLMELNLQLTEEKMKLHGMDLLSVTGDWDSISKMIELEVKHKMDVEIMNFEKNKPRASIKIHIEDLLNFIKLKL